MTRTMTDILISFFSIGVYYWVIYYGQNFHISLQWFLKFICYISIVTGILYMNRVRLAGQGITPDSRAGLRETLNLGCVICAFIAIYELAWILANM